MPHATLLQDLSVVMIVAAIVTVLFRQFKQPVVLGYILAGIIIGPHTPPFPLIADEHTIETLSELGVIFLMFSLGLEFSLRKLKDVGTTALIAAFFEILLMVWAGYELGRLFGWRQMDCIFLGAILSISSTTIIIKALEELGKTRERFAELLFGILIVEDILAIVMIALLSGFATTGSFAPAEIGMTVVKLSAFLGALLVVGLIFVPRFLNYVASFKSNEMLLITVVGLCFGVSLLAVKLGYSVALGAFLIGAIIAEARQITTIEAITNPVRDLFSAVFFVSIGLLIDPKLLVQYAGPIVVITAVVVVGKIVSCSFGTFVAGHDRYTSLRVGMGLAQIGEFSFIIASLGLSLKVTSDFLYPIAVAVSALTTLFTPYLFRSSEMAIGLFDRFAPAPIASVLDAYTRWVGQIGSSRENSPARSLIRKWILQIGLNLLLTTGVFIVAIAMQGRASAIWPATALGPDGIKAMLWLASMVVSLPMLIASFRKMQAFAMLLSELSVSKTDAGENTMQIRSLVAGTILIAGCAGLFLFILILSSAILPSWKVLIGVLLVVAASAILLWRLSIRVYARAQVALRDTFANQAATQHHPKLAEFPPLLRDVQMKHLKVTDGSPAAGKLIRDFRLRSQTGASIVGIEKADGKHLINPGADEEVQTGDRLLLLGNPQQLQAAANFLGGQAEGTEYEVPHR